MGERRGQRGGQSIEKAEGYNLGKKGLTITIGGLGISRTRSVILDISGGNEYSVLERGTGGRKIFGIFESDARSIALSGSGGYDAFIAKGGFSGQSDGSPLCR